MPVKQIKVKVSPKSKKNEVVLVKNDEYRVFTTQAASDGLANQAVLKLLAEYFKIAPNRIFLKSGVKNRQKVFEILD